MPKTDKTVKWRRLRKPIARQFTAAAALTGGRTNPMHTDRHQACRTVIDVKRRIYLAKLNDTRICQRCGIFDERDELASPQTERGRSRRSRRVGRADRVHIKAEERIQARTVADELVADHIFQFDVGLGPRPQQLEADAVDLLVADKLVTHRRTKVRLKPDLVEICRQQVAAVQQLSELRSAVSLVGEPHI